MYQVIFFIISIVIALSLDFFKVAIFIITLFVSYLILLVKKIDDTVYTSNITDDVRFFSLLKKFDLNQEEMNEISNKVEKEKFSQEEIEKYRSKLRKLGYIWV